MSAERQMFAETGIYLFIFRGGWILRCDASASASGTERSWPKNVMIKVFAHAIIFFPLIILINLLHFAGQADSSVQSKNINILSEGLNDVGGSLENKVLLKLKEVEKELKSLRRNYNYYVNLTEKMENKMEEIKYNMSSLFERRFHRLVQQVEEKVTNQHNDQTG